MDKIRIRGGKKLEGVLSAGGSKNSCLPLFFSTLLAPGSHTFHNVPKVKDIETAGKLLTQLGCQVDFSDNSVQIIVPEQLQSTKADYELMRTMRAGVLCLGPLLARAGQAEVSLPGGCAIGSRPVNWHIENLRKMGSHISIQSGYIHGKNSMPLKGSDIIFEKPSVGGTQNLMMAGVLAQGQTRIYHAAQEPEVVDLAQYLKKMGAHISGEGTSMIQIKGVSHLTSGQHRVISDRIETATLLIAGGITKGNVRVTECHPQHLEEILLKLKESGFKIQTGKDWVELSSPSSFSAVSLSTAPYPGFPTDMQAQFMALMTQAEGVSFIEECVFENRFMHIPELNRLKAHIVIHKQKAQIYGSRKLEGAIVTATDLRASAGLVLAGLAAQGESQILRMYHLDRGYEKLEEKLSLLGADIERH